MRAVVTALLVAALTAIFAGAQAPAAKTLDIYIVDVEGGTAILFVSPSGESILIDSGGNPRTVVDPRDAGRIMDAVKAAGLQKIDHMITSHYDYDHYAGLADLASRIKIEEYIDHGPNAQPNEQADTFLKDVYPQLYAKAKHTVVKAGDRISLAGAEVRVVTSAGEIIKTPLPGGGKPNHACAARPNVWSTMEDPTSLSL